MPLDPPLLSGGLPIEILGGFSVGGAGRWQRLLPATRRALAVDGVGLLHAPEIGEPAQISGPRGRPRGFERARRLRELADLAP